MTLLLALLACAPSPDLEARLPILVNGEVDLHVDVACADPDCNELLLDGSASFAPGDGIASYSFTLPDGSVTWDAWAFYTPSADLVDLPGSESVEFAVELDSGQTLIRDVPFAGFPGLSPTDTALVYFTGGVTKNLYSVTGSCRFKLNIVGCISGVQDLIFREEGESTGSYLVQGGSRTSVAAPTVTLQAGESLTYEVTHVYDDDHSDTKSMTITCGSPGISKGP